MAGILSADIISNDDIKGRLAPDKKWSDIVALVDDLPPLPLIARQAMTLADDPNVNVGKLASVMSKDAALASRVLRIANSAMYACERNITTLNQAILVIGFSTLRGLIVSSALRQMNKSSSELESTIWRNSYCTAIGAQILARTLKKRYIDESFLDGLLHDLGKLAMLRQLSDTYRDVYTKAGQGMLLFELEQKEFGFAHPLIGALIAKKWNFPPETCHVILKHHDILPATSNLSIAEERTRIVQAANLISHHLGFGVRAGDSACAEEMYTALAQLSVQSDVAAELLVKVYDEFMENSIT